MKRLLAILVVFTAVGGCAPADDPMLVMSHHACRTLTPGIEVISFERLGRIRGLEFMSVDDPVRPSATEPVSPAATEPASPTATKPASQDATDSRAESEPRLIAIAVPAPAAGGSLVIGASRRSTTGLVIDVALDPSSTGAKLTLTPEGPTLPCLVFATLQYDQPIVARFEGTTIGSLPPIP